MDTKKPGIKELDPNEMEKAAGGCIFGCHYHIRSTKYRGNDTYEFFKCPDCGNERYKKNDEDIYPSDFWNA